MLVIRQEQMFVLQRSALLAFEQRAATYLRVSIAEDVLERATGDLAAYISAGIATAREFNICSEAEIVRFLEISLSYRLSVESAAFSKGVVNRLRAYGVPAMTRLERMEEYLQQGNSSEFIRI